MTESCHFNDKNSLGGSFCVWRVGSQPAGSGICQKIHERNHAFVVCTHIDKAHIHNHIIWSAVNTDCDRKFRNFWGSTRAVRRLNDTICIENGLSIVENR